MFRRIRAVSAVVALLAIAACAPSDDTMPNESPSLQAYVDQYASVRLSADISHLSENDRQVVRVLMEAMPTMDEIFWIESYGDRDAAMALAGDDEAARKYIEINMGPWDRLRDNEPFIDGVGPKPLGANQYPMDMTVEEFEATAAANPDLKGLYTLVRRNGMGALIAVPYHEAFAEEHAAAAAKLREAAELSSDPEFAEYLRLRADALMTDDYQASDFAWMNMKNNPIDVVIGPIETYEDALFGYKAGHEGYVLIKDLAWSDRLARFASFLPDLQRGLPVDAKYKAETPGTDADLNAYDVVYYAGEANTGGKTIAINLPNDEEVQLAKGTRRLQLKNAMQAKFDRILVPIAGMLIAEDQRQHVTFDAFFGNVMFHEVAHGLGIKNTLDGRGTVRQALKEQASALEEGKADVLGLYMVAKLHEMNELANEDLNDNMVTFMASIFRSIRFGASSAHGRANVARFNFFKEMGAFSRDPATGTYRVDFAKMREAMNALSAKILTYQGDGDYYGVQDYMEKYGTIGPELRADLDRLATAGIPVDIVFEQGMAVLQQGQ